MGLEKIVISLVSSGIKDLARFDLSADELQAKFQKGCPVLSELKKIINQKNTISKAINSIEPKLKSLNTTENTIDTILTSLQAVVTTIKVLPAPTSSPPGVGIPLSIITTLSDVLDFIGDKIKEGKGIISVIPQSIESMKGILDTVREKLNVLDQSILKCLESASEGLTVEEKQELIEEVGLTVEQLDETEDTTESLESQLQPGSSNPLGYNGYILTIEHDPDNEFPFPRRRVKGTKGEEVILGDYSYSATTVILVDEVKFKIDNL